MQCETCGTTGAGTFCAQCGARLDGGGGETSSDVFWADDDATRVAEASPTNRWQEADQVPGTTREPTSTDFPGYPWAAGPAAGSASPPPSGPPPGAYGTGYPPPSGPPQKGASWPLAVGAALVAGLLILAIGGGALWFLTSSDSDAAVTDSSSTGTSTSSQSTSSDTPTTTITSTTTSTSSGTTSAEDELGNLRGDSLSRLSTNGRWAVSLSAKQDGTRDDRQVTSSGSHVFRLPDILELHEEYDGTYSSSASVYLIKAEDLGSSSGPDASRIWMTIVDPGGLSSREDAKEWCEGEFPHLSGDDLDNACYPRQLTSP